jgi:hypothetical protein
LLPSRIARFTRSATGIPNIHSRYFCPDIAAGLWRDEAPLALPPLRLEVAEPVVAVILLILVQSPASE